MAPPAGIEPSIYELKVRVPSQLEDGGIIQCEHCKILYLYSIVKDQNQNLYNKKPLGFRQGVFLNSIVNVKKSPLAPIFQLVPQYASGKFQNYNLFSCY